MNDKELIEKIRELRQIKPKKEWVFLTKVQILGKEERRFSPFSFLVFKLTPTGLIVIFVLFGLFGLAQNSLPGDFLYPIKKITEKSQTVFVSEEEKPQVSLELANKRLEELTIMVATSQAKKKKLVPAIFEFQATLSEATQNLSRVDTTSSDLMTVKKFIDQAKTIETKAKGIQSLGVEIGEEKLEELKETSTKLELELLIRILKGLVSDLEKMSLTEEKQEMLKKMKELIREEKYSQALEFYLINQ